MAGKTSKVHLWKSPRRLAGVVTTVMAVNLAVTLSLVVILLAFGTASDYAGVTRPSPVQWLRLLLDIARLLVLLAAISSLFWIYRVSANAHTFRSNLSVSPWGAILWYLVPIAALYKPYQAMSETWRASESSGAGAANPPLPLWWGLFLLHNVLGSMQTVFKPLARSIPLLVAYDITGVAVTVLFVLIVRRITAMQTLKHMVEPFGDAAPAAAGGLERFLR